MGFMGRRNRTSRMTLPRRVYGGSTLNYPSRRSYHVRPSVCSAVPWTRRTVADCGGLCQVGPEARPNLVVGGD